MIRIKNLTKDFGRHRGIFDLSFEVQDGEVFGYLGPNGAGKTTTIRQLLGFASPTRGRCFINGKSCHAKADEIAAFTGYLPGELNLPGGMTGLSFLRLIAQMRGTKSLERALKLSERFELDLDEKIRKMSKGTKQKVGIVCAFMHDPEVLLLDEPTSGLDPLMQNRFIELILEEKGRGKTMLLSSHMFEEVERTCDRVGMLRGGVLVNVDDIAGIRAAKKKSYMITFASEQEALRFVKEEFQVLDVNGPQVTVSLSGEMMPLVKSLGNYQVVGLETAVQSLEEIFMHYYGGNADA